MKKLFLLLAAGFAVSANAQVGSSMLHTGHTGAALPTYVDKFDGKTATPVAHKTTGSHSYWYSYTGVNYQDPISKFHLYPIYNDSTIYVPAGTPTPFYWWLMGLGTSFDPTSTTFRPPLTNAAATPPDFNITSTNPYTVDSIHITGFYDRQSYNPYVDTLYIYVALAGGTTPGPAGTAIFSGKDVYYKDNLGIPDSTLRFADMQYDSISNGILSSQVPGVLKITKLLDAAAFIDTASNGLHEWTFALPSTLNATAGQKVVAMLQYVSGNTYAFGTNIDSVNKWYVGTYELQGNATFPHQNLKDLNAGLLTTNDSRYDINNQALISGGKHYMNSTYQYPGSAGYDDPIFAFHVTCASCPLLSVPAVYGNVGEVKAYPNPAANELSVEFKLASKGDAVVTISNILGEVVATQTVKNAKDGKVVFNTAALPSGMYMFGVSANGQRSAGRVSVAH